MNVTQKILWQCDICGKQDNWSSEWICHVYAIGHDEPEFHLCSIECDEKLSKMTKKQRKELLNKLFMNRPKFTMRD